MERKVWLISCLLLWPLRAHASTVCHVKSTGQVAETSVTTLAEGICVKNLTSSGIPESDVEQLTVSESERQAAVKAWENNPKNPNVAKQQATDDDRRKKRERVQIKLGLSDQDFKDLQEALE